MQSFTATACSTKSWFKFFAAVNLGKGIFVVVKDQGQGFDPNTVPDPTAAENISADHGRGIWLMKTVMDEVSFECGGTEVRMRKTPRRKPGTECEAPTK
jgi:anti-sigma regulatory factor (Ser/Thr protein kinase)